MKAKDFDKKFDNGKSVVTHLDLSKARRPIGAKKQELFYEKFAQLRINENCNG